jgi:hypothetical protein
MEKSKKFTAEELQVIADIQQERGTTRKSAIRYFQKNRDKYMTRGTKAAAAPAVDVKQRAANDRPEAEEAKKPKAAPMKLTPEQVSANRKEGLRLFALAGKPSKQDFVRVFGAKGAAMTWIQRAKHLGVATTDEAALRCPKAK